MTPRGHNLLVWRMRARWNRTGDLYDDGFFERERLALLDEMEDALGFAPSVAMNQREVARLGQPDPWVPGHGTRGSYDLEAA